MRLTPTQEPVSPPVTLFRTVDLPADPTCDPCIARGPPSSSPIVPFRAAGWTEMAWHLYQWGDTVEVIAPKKLREMVEGYRCSDFYPVLP